MSTASPATIQMVTEHAMRVAQTLSPAMKQAMLKVDRNMLLARRVQAGTIVALMRRELMEHQKLATVEDGRYVEVDHDYDGGRTLAGHLLTELGEAVLQVLVRGPEEALKRAIAADEDDHDPLTRNERLAEDDAEATLAAESAARDLTTRMQSAIMTTKSGPHIIGQLPTLRALEARGLAKVDDSLAYRAGRAFVLTDLGKAVYNLIEGAPAPVIDVDAELPVEYSENLHDVLIMASHRHYRVVDGDVFQADNPGRLASETDMICLETADKAGLIEERITIIPKVSYFQLTDAGMRVLLTFDAKHGRQGMPYTAELPPREVLLAQPTKAAVGQHPEYYIPGPGRLLAEQVLCDHGYRLTDSCPVCP